MLGFNGKLLDFIYPVGSYYETSDTSFNPNTAWGGTWLEDTKGRVTVALDSNDTDFDTINETGGEKTHVLTIAEMPSHNHKTFGSYAKIGSGTIENTWLAWSSGNANVQNTGENKPHNNLQPYVVVKRWHRTA